MKADAKRRVIEVERKQKAINETLDRLDEAFLYERTIDIERKELVGTGLTPQIFNYLRPVSESKKKWWGKPSWNFSAHRTHSMNEVDDVSNDAKLLERARLGDERAFAQLFGRHQAAIYRYAVHMCGPDTGDDIVQDTFLAVLRQRGRRDAPRHSVGGYLFGIARHLVLQRLGSKYQPAFVEAGDEDVSQLASPALTALEDLTRAETIASVRAAVQSLPPVYREVVVLCDLQNMDYAAAAGVLQCPVGTIRSRLSRARALLVAKLKDFHPTASTRQA